MNISLPDKVKDIITRVQSAGFGCYAVGGSVRDYLLGRPTKGWDFATNATPEEIQKIFPDSFYDNQFGTVGVKIKNGAGEIIDIYEITPFRKEGKYSDLRHPDKIEWAKTIEEDLARRDFTINAITITFRLASQGDALESVVLDPVGGLSDLQKKTIHAVGNPDDRFREDALRLMRAIRIASQLGFLIEKNTWESIIHNSNFIIHVSSERIRDELVKILQTNYPADGIRLLHNAGLLDFILPELTKGVGVSQKGTHHRDDVFEHSLKSLAFCQNPSWVVRLATLLHDVGKPVTFRERNGKATFYNHESVGAGIVKDIAHRLRLAKEDREKLWMLVRWHMFSVSEFLSDTAVRRFIRRVGPENTTDMLDLRTADRIGSGTKPTSWRHEEFKKRIIEVQKHVPSIKDLKVTGHDVMQVLGIQPGRKVGEILKKLFEEIMEDPEKNERDFLIERITELGKT